MVDGAAARRPLRIRENGPDSPAHGTINSPRKNRAITFTLESHRRRQHSRVRARITATTESRRDATIIARDAPTESLKNSRITAQDAPTESRRDGAIIAQDEVLGKHSL
jgi:hypothetical protein